MDQIYVFTQRSNTNMQQIMMIGAINRAVVVYADSQSRMRREEHKTRIMQMSCKVREKMLT